MDWPTWELRLGTPGSTLFDSKRIIKISAVLFKILTIKELWKTLITIQLQDTHAKIMKGNTKKLGLGILKLHT